MYFQVKAMGDGLLRSLMGISDLQGTASSKGAHAYSSKQNLQIAVRCIFQKYYKRYGYIISALETMYYTFEGL